MHKKIGSLKEFGVIVNELFNLAKKRYSQITANIFNEILRLFFFNHCQSYFHKILGIQIDSGRYCKEASTYLARVGIVTYCAQWRTQDFSMGGFSKVTSKICSRSILWRINNLT